MIQVGGKDVIVVDAHTHFWKTFHGERFGNTPVVPLGFGKAEQGGEVFALVPPEFIDCSAPYEILLTHMEYTGVDKALIPQNPCYGDQREYVREVMQKVPGKFVTIGMVDPRNKETLIQEIDTLVDDYGCKGVKMEIPDVPFIMDSSDYDFFWKKIVDKDIIAMIDLGWHDGPYDFNVDRMRNVLKKFPQMKVVLAHLGISRLWDLNQKYPFDQMQRTLSLLDVNKDNLYLDLSGIPFFNPKDEYPFYRGQDIIRAVKMSVGMDKIMWGSDFPTTMNYCTYQQTFDLVYRHCTFLTDYEMEMVIGGTAMKVYFGD